MTKFFMQHIVVHIDLVYDDSATNQLQNKEIL